MKNFITNSWHDEECFIQCDCESEGLHFFLDTSYEESLIGFSFYRAFNNKKKIDYYHEFPDIDEVKKFIHLLGLEATDGFIALRNYYGMYAGWYDDQTFILEIYKFNKRFKYSKKPIFQLSFSKDKVDQLKEELQSWLERHEN